MPDQEQVQPAQQTPETLESAFDIPGTEFSSPNPPEQTTEQPQDRQRRPDGTFLPKDAPAAPSAPSHPGSLIRQARELGWADDDIAATPTDALYRAVFHAFRDRETLRQQFATEFTLNNRQAQQAAPPPVAQAEPELFGFEESELDPRLVKALKAQQQKDKELAELRAWKETVEQREEKRVAQSGAEKIDSAFAALKGFEKQFGVEPISEMDQTKDRAIISRRLAVLREAGINLKELPTAAALRSKLQAAAELLFGAGSVPHTADPANPYEVAAQRAPPGGKPSVSKEDWQNGTVARPTQRAGAAEMKGEELAVQNLRRRMRDLEASEQEGDSEIKNGLM